jgi:hypothetical protein
MYTIKKNTMETSIFIAKIIATIYLSFGAGLLFSGNYYKKEMAKLLDNSALMIFGGFMAIILGLLVIENHNYWVKNWTVLITIIGWIALIKGIFLLAFPRSLNFFKPMLTAEYSMKFLAPLVIIFGLVFAYFGFL